MNDIKEACELVLKKNPNKIIKCILEFDEVYQFTLANENEELNELCMYDKTPTVKKDTFEYLGELEPFDAYFMGDFKKVDLPKTEENKLSSL